MKKYLEAFRLAWPLALGMANNAVMQFVDRVFLAKESTASLEAVLPAAIVASVFVCFFQSAVAYSGTFVAQFHGAGDSVGERRSFFGGLWLTLASAVCLWCLIPVGGWVFNLAGHAPEIVVREKSYYGVVMAGGFALCGQMAASGYFTGRGQTRLVFAVNLAGNALNVLLDWVLIFGCGPVPACGIAGAAWATVLAQLFQMAVLCLLAARSCRAEARRDARAWRSASDEDARSLFFKMIRYGVPAGVYAALNLLSFAIFVLITGKVGDLAFAVSNAAFTVNYLLIAPIEGFAVAGGILVGQNMGADDPREAGRAGNRIVALSLLYVVGASAFVLAFNRPILDLFLSDASDAAAFHELGFSLFALMVAWQCFDTVDVVLSGTLKGAGDTHFVMVWMLVCAFGAWLPLVFAVYAWRPTMPALWGTMVAYVVLMFAGTVWRWLWGPWRKIRLIA